MRRIQRKNPNTEPAYGHSGPQEIGYRRAGKPLPAFIYETGLNKAMKKNMITVAVLAAVFMTVSGCGVSESSKSDTEFAANSENVTNSETVTETAVQTETAELIDQTQADESENSSRTAENEDEKQDTSIQDSSPSQNGEEDPMYAATGLSETDALQFAQQLVDFAAAGDKEAVADTIAYPRKVTVENRQIIVNNRDEFLLCYDDIFTADFISLLSEELQNGFFWNNGMISFGNGEIWFMQTENGVKLQTIQNGNGNSVRYAGKGGVWAE